MGRDITGCTLCRLFRAKEISAIDTRPDEVFDENKEKVSETLSKENNLNTLYLFIILTYPFTQYRIMFDKNVCNTITIQPRIQYLYLPTFQ